MRKTAKKTGVKRLTAVKKCADDFESVARRLGCDDDKDRFEARLGKLAKAKNAPLKRPKRGAV